MNIQEIIKRLKGLEEPFKLDPYLDEEGRGIENLVGYIQTLREELEEDSYKHQSEQGFLFHKINYGME